MSAIYSTSYYAIVDGPSWTKAEANAAALGGYLVSINNADENAYVNNIGLAAHARGETDNWLWIGVRGNTDGSITLSSGEELTYSNWHSGGGPNDPQLQVYLSSIGFAGVLEPYIRENGEWSALRGTNHSGNTKDVNPNGYNIRGIAEVPLSYFTISDLTVTEGESGTVTISRTGGTKSSQSLILKSEDGSAEAGSDYDTINTTIHFAANETSKAISIKAKNDGIKEESESFKLQLIPSTKDIVPAQLGSKSTGTVWVVDNSSNNQTVNINGGKSNTGINNGNIFNGDIFNGDIGNTGINTGTIINGDLNVTVDNSVNKNATINLINLFEENIVSRPIFFGGKHVEKMFVDISKFASQKADKIGGTELADFLQMGDGDDEFTGGLGGDSIYGNKGRDILYGNQGDDEIKGNMGDDIIYGGKDADSIYGNLDNDKLYGNIGNDYLYGGQGDDVIYAGKGDDYVYGNKGNDTLYGNKGADTFVCTKGFDVIKDFWGLDGDKISVASVAGAVISERDGSTLITSGEGQLLLEGFARQFFDESQYLV